MSLRRCLPAVGRCWLGILVRELNFVIIFRHKIERRAREGEEFKFGELQRLPEVMFLENKTGAILNRSESEDSGLCFWFPRLVEHIKALLIDPNKIQDPQDLDDHMIIMMRLFYSPFSKNYGTDIK